MKFFETEKRKRIVRKVFEILALCLLVYLSPQAFAQAGNNLYTYDSLNRLTKVAYSTGASITYTYDAAGNRTFVQVNGVEFKADVTPRPAGKKNGTIARADWDQVGRFASGLDAVNANELQRADSAPFNTSGDGKVDVLDWVQAGRFFAGLDDLVPAASGVVAALAFAPQSEAGTRAVRIVSATLQRGQVNEIKIEFDAQGDENALAFSLNFDPTLFTFTNATLGSGATGAQLIVNPNQAANGRVGFGIALNPGQTFPIGTHSILTLQLQASSGNSTTTAISFGDQPITRGVADVYANALNTAYTDASITVNGDAKPAPTITSINPTTAVAGSTGFTLTVTGKDFVNGAIIYWGSKPLSTNFSSSTQLTGTVTAAELTSATTINVTVVNPAPNSATSNAIPFTISLPPTNRNLRIVSSSGTAGGTAVVPLELVSDGDVNTMGFSLSFDPAILSNPTVSPGSDATGATLLVNTSQVASGKLGVVIAAPNGQVFGAGIRRLALISFNVAAGTQGVTTTLNFGDFPLERQMINVAALPLPANYTPGTITITSGYEADVAPRPNGSGNGTVTIADWVQAGRFAAALDTPAVGSEFQRADNAPKATLGDGKLSISDWVQAGRYAAGLDAVVAAGGPITHVASLTATEARGTFNVQPEAVRIMRAVNANFQRGQLGLIQIELEGQGNENAVSFSLNFDPKEMTFVDATVSNGANGAALQVNKSETGKGQIGFALALPAGQQLAAGTRTLLTLRFIPNGGDGDVVTNIGFSDQILAREIVDAWAAPLPQVSYTGGAITIRGRTVANVSAASYVGADLAADSIASAFGTGLATMTTGAASVPLPNTLGGTSVKVKDALGVERIAPLFFVSPTQINYQIPAGTADGIAAVTITNGAGEVTAGLLSIGKVAPGLFAADASGKGWAAAEVVSVASDGSQTLTPVARFDAGQNKFVALPIDVQTTRAVLVLYGTGIRQRSDVAQVKVKIGGIEAAVEYAGAQSSYAGLDQINAIIPRSLSGRGEITIELIAEGKSANPVKMYIR